MAIILALSHPVVLLTAKPLLTIVIIVRLIVVEIHQFILSER